MVGLVEDLPVVSRYVVLVGLGTWILPSKPSTSVLFNVAVVENSTICMQIGCLTMMMSGVGYHLGIRNGGNQSLRNCRS
jgi:putative Mn2+ efflux pump MntP